jgi:hypothetical protein
MTRQLNRAHQEFPATASCDHCHFSYTVATKELNADVYRAAKNHAREIPGHRTRASITREHAYVVPTSGDVQRS